MMDFLSYFILYTRCTQYSTVDICVASCKPHYSPLFKKNILQTKSFGTVAPEYYVQLHSYNLYTRIQKVFPAQWSLRQHWPIPQNQNPRCRQQRGIMFSIYFLPLKHTTVNCIQRGVPQRGISSNSKLYSQRRRISHHWT